MHSATKFSSATHTPSIPLLCTVLHCARLEWKMAAADMKTTVRRDVFKSFWNKYSDSPDNNAMMLNHNAEELESSDRNDILSSLPDLSNKDVVDIGAGIGRFTTMLARTAKSVLSTDFIDTFILKNRERNMHLENVSYQVGDAVNLVLDSNSVDLVFTNWLMMYLNDGEVMQFLNNAIRWLRPEGYLHLRESCSEPSTARSKSTMHSNTDSNPTSYRFSSLYIKLLRTIRYRCPEGKLWRFEVLWSASVPTYVQSQSNWRQVHWLVRKVLAEDDDWEPTTTELLQLFSFEWNRIQKHWDSLLDNEQYCWTDRIFGAVMSSEFVPKNSTVFSYNPRRSAFHVHINAHLLSEKFTCNVWNVESNEYYYRTSLTKANDVKDQRVRFGWNQSLQSAIDYWTEREGTFSAFVATELLATVDDETLAHLPAILKPEAQIVTLEPVEDEISVEELKMRLSRIGWRSVNMTVVTEPAKELQKEYFKTHSLQNETVVAGNWVLIVATL
uniref:phosphoethanolamine N-methyltransferase n=2 Tax=Steinernema glaseri TaxID=37863 RepID=A0A1I7ZV71_9BILA